MGNGFKRRKEKGLKIRTGIGVVEKYLNRNCQVTSCKHTVGYAMSEDF